MTANQALLASQGILEVHIADSDAAYQNAMSRADALEARLAQLNILPDQLDEAKGALVTLQGDYDAVSRQKDQLALQVAESQASAVQRQIQAEETWTQERSRLRSEIEQLRNTADEISSRSSSNQAQLASLIEEVTTARSRVTTLEQQLDSAGEQTSEMTAITARLQSAEEELGRQRVVNSQLQGAFTTERRSHESRSTSLERENDALGTRLRQAQNTLDRIAAAARVLNLGSGGITSATPRLRSPSTSTSRPATTSRPAAARTHVVEGDSLTCISMLYYGTPTRWQDIYQANRETLSEANALRPGQQLQIP